MAEITDVGPAIREARRPVTALFADLVRSTARAERLEDAESRLVVGDAIAGGRRPTGAAASSSSTPPTERPSPSRSP